jgi:AcrR family transcriptional regulator
MRHSTPNERYRYHSTQVSLKGGEVTSGTHERILCAAVRLFAEEGVFISVDRIADAAGVATMTIYRHFDDKDALVAAALDHASRDCLGRLDERLAEYGSDPTDRFVGLQETLAKWLAGEGRKGWLIAYAAAELRGRSDHPAQAVIAEHRRSVRCRFERLAEEAGQEDPGTAAEELQMLVDAAGVATVADHRMPGPWLRFPRGESRADRRS